jgi:excisionase family DNA binding protein
MAQVEPAGLTRAEAAALLNVHKNTIDNMARAGTLEYFRIGKNLRGKRYTRESINKVLAGRARPKGR